MADTSGTPDAANLSKTGVEPSPAVEAAPDSTATVLLQLVNRPAGDYFVMHFEVGDGDSEEVRVGVEPTPVLASRARKIIRTAASSGRYIAEFVAPVSPDNEDEV